MHLEKFNLEGKTALVTGGAGLLGIEHTLALLECGAKVVVTDINERSLKKAAEFFNQKAIPEGKIITKCMDVTKALSVEAVAEELSLEKIRIDILINNAAIDPKVDESSSIVESSRLENFSMEEWNLQISVGLGGAFLCSKVFGKAMAEDGKGGVILNVSSDLSVFSPDQRLYRKEGLEEDSQPVKPVTYSVIKTGLIGLTRYLATYWVDKGIRCNALSPGGVFNGQGEEFVERLSNLIPQGRMATLDEYHSAVQFLCSNASQYMNGQNIVIDGGRSVW